MEISSLFIPVEASIKMKIPLSKEDLLQKIEKLNEISYLNYHLVQTPECDIDFKDLFTLENENIFLEDTDFKESEVIKTMDTANKDLTKAELSPVFLPTYETVFNAESENKILTDSF